MNGEELFACIVGVAIFYFFYYIASGKDREMARRGYRPVGGYHNQHYVPDPKQRSSPDFPEVWWESRGYKWSEKYQKWYLPKSKENS